MKRLTILIGTIVVSCLVLFGIRKNFETATAGDPQTIIVYNWGDYIDPELIAQFEQETGYKVIYETFDSNEAMLTKIKQGGTNYDIAIPSEYTINKMVKENLLEKLDYSKIKGMEHIDPRFLHKSFDPENTYSIPYFWGTLGIVYNTKVYPEGTISEWRDLWNEDLKDSILFIDGAREMMGIALQTQGYSLNEKDEAIVKEAGKFLKTLMPNAKAIIADEMKTYMIQGEANVAVTFSGEASKMLSQNEDLAYVVPSEGTNLWFDNIVIPKTVGNKEGAYAFINFMLRPEIAAKNAQYVGYATPNKDALALLPEDITSDESFYPSEEAMEKMEVYENLGTDLLSLYNDLFLEAKIFRN